MGIPIVLYSDEHLEPITVVSVPASLLRRAQDGDLIRIAVPPVIRPLSYEIKPVLESELMSVTFWAEPFVRSPRGHRRAQQRDWLYFVRDEELALRLRPDYLAGQRRDVYLRERAAFLTGVFAGMGEE